METEKSINSPTVGTKRKIWAFWDHVEPLLSTSITYCYFNTQIVDQKSSFFGCDARLVMVWSVYCDLSLANFRGENTLFLGRHQTQFHRVYRLQFWVGHNWIATKSKIWNYKICTWNVYIFFSHSTGETIFCSIVIKRAINKTECLVKENANSP